MISASSRQRERYLDRATVQAWVTYLAEIGGDTALHTLPVIYLRELYYYRDPVNMVHAIARRFDDESQRETVVQLLRDLNRLEALPVVGGTFNSFNALLRSNPFEAYEKLSAPLQTLSAGITKYVASGVAVGSSEAAQFAQEISNGLLVFAQMGRLLMWSTESDQWWLDTARRDQLCEGVVAGTLQRYLHYCAEFFNGRALTNP